MQQNVKGQFERIDTQIRLIILHLLLKLCGNGQNAIALGLKQVDHFIDFDASSTGNAISISEDTIGFGTFHKFRDGEPQSINI